ncbi:16S rRNA (cytidine(1402)-2'-O)-methyltransferase [Planctomycetota bacterium]
MLYLIATPIGNLSDMSQRAIDTLKAVDLVASEDTRHTGRLLKHFEISRPQMSFHEHNKDRAVGRIITMLQEGKSIALVADAGTPGISDPGFSLVRAVHEACLEVTMVPGPTAFVMALILSGLPSHAFTFRGFAPRKSGPRCRFFSVDVESPHTLIYYESPYRLRRFLDDALEVFGNRRAALVKELTKLYEGVRRGRLSELRETLEEKPKGEYVIVVHGATDTLERESL